MSAGSTSRPPRKTEPQCTTCSAFSAWSPMESLTRRLAPSFGGYSICSDCLLRVFWMMRQLSKFRGSFRRALSMPYASDKQRKYLHAKKPEVAARYDRDIKAGKKKTVPKKKGRK